MRSAASIINGRAGLTDDEAGMGNPIVKTNDSFSTRSRALAHVAIMYNGQHGSDAEVDKPDHCQESGQFTGFRDFEYVHR